MAKSCLLFFALAVLATTSSQVIETKLGSLRGEFRTSRDGRKYTSWTKIPYAKPPIGPLRLVNPVPYGKWDGELDATQELPSCVQGFILGFGVSARATGKEDCLYLNVYKPDTNEKNLPVIFYIHGGGFLFGHPGGRNLADYIMDENAILVAITYRLGLLGFMSLNDSEFSGNFGLKDQALALEWVYENIESFGGDPSLITVVGESAGGVCAHFMLESPKTKDMVASAYLISGVIQKFWGLLRPEVVKSTTEYAIGKLNCNKGSTNKTLECLQSIEDPIKIAETSGDLDPGDVDIFVVGPTIEPASPEAFNSEDLSRSASSTKPLMLSYAAGEYLLFEIDQVFKDTGKAKRIKNDTDGYARSVIEKFHSDETRLTSAANLLRERYLNKDGLSDIHHGLSMIFQDMGFVNPALELADSHKGPVWIYQMLHRGEVSHIDIAGRMNSDVASHTDDIFYLFNIRGRFPDANPLMDKTDERISRLLVKQLVNFARYGNPTPNGSSIWKRYTGKEIYRVTTEGFVEGEADFIKEQKDIQRLWKTLLNQTPIKDEL